MNSNNNNNNRRMHTSQSVPILFRPAQDLNECDHPHQDEYIENNHQEEEYLHQQQQQQQQQDDVEDDISGLEMGTSPNSTLSHSHSFSRSHSHSLIEEDDHDDISQSESDGISTSSQSESLSDDDDEASYEEQEHETSSDDYDVDMNMDMGVDMNDMTMNDMNMNMGIGMGIDIEQPLEPLPLDPLQLHQRQDSVGTGLTRMTGMTGILSTYTESTAPTVDCSSDSDEQPQPHPHTLPLSLSLQQRNMNRQLQLTTTLPTTLSSPHFHHHRQPHGHGHALPPHSHAHSKRMSSSPHLPPRMNYGGGNGKHLRVRSGHGNHGHASHTSKSHHHHHHSSKYGKYNSPSKSKGHGHGHGHGYRSSSHSHATSSRSHGHSHSSSKHSHSHSKTHHRSNHNHVHHRTRPPTKMTRKKRRHTSMSAVNVERWVSPFNIYNILYTVRNSLFALWILGVASMFLLNNMYGPGIHPVTGPGAAGGVAGVGGVGNGQDSNGVVHVHTPAALTGFALGRHSISSNTNSLEQPTTSTTNTNTNHMHNTKTKSTPFFPFFSSSNGRPNYDHIPLPPPEQKVSVVLMNFSRPRMIRESSLMRTLVNHPSVDEVILLHANPKTAFTFVHPKVVNVDASKENDQMGLSLRFYFCQLVKNEWVLHVDDDMEFTPRALSEMLNEFSKDTHRIVGRYGRNRKENSFFNGYSSKNTHKATEVILTKLMVMERDVCGAFFEHAHLIWEDTILNNGEGPLWNGEDIFMSLVANHIYGGDKIHYAMDWLDVWSAPDSLKDYGNGRHDISGGFSGLRFWDWHWWHSILRRNRHYTYRGTLWKTAKERLAGSFALHPSVGTK